MASTASSSTAPSSSTLHEESRPEAGPLPTKRGEIGYREELHAAGNQSRGSSPGPSPLPERHPADRDAPPLISEPSAATTSASPTQPTAPTSTSTPSTTPASPISDDASSTNSLKAKKSFLGFLKPKKIPSYGGLRLTTLLAFMAQLIVLGGTFAAWAISVMLLARSDKKASDSNGDQGTAGGSSTIFVHVIFCLVALGQLLFLERRIFRLRAERYAFLHPGEMLPTSWRHRPADPSISFSPWNRPPLPTYAAALAQSGVGTGDVEDHIIAAPPPPAYGNTRGSTLLLAGFLRASLRAQRPVSAQSQMSQQRSERPLSYASQDEDWEVIQDAERARRLEETLSTLERAPSRTRRA